MSSYPPPPSAPLPGAPQHFPPLPPTRPKNWFDRNWKWMVPLVVVLFFTLIGGFVAAILFGVSHMMRDSIPYQVAVDRATKNTTVQAELGAPIKVGWFTSGNINLNGPSGSASLAIPLSGPKGSGVVFVEAKRRAGIWRYETLEFAPSNGDRVPLLDSGLPQIPASPPPSEKSDDGST
jgi:Cytochrome oxidase complex assembly protein 1